MLVPGLVAFAVYRVAKQLLPLTDPIVLLTVSGLVGVGTALLSYRAGRSTAWRVINREDGRKLLVWIGGWIGFIYAVQLSLLVLALLWLVGYDYLKHPDGPAMMAIIIASTAVARDAFEIGYIRRFALLGRPVPTFPNGIALRSLLKTHTALLLPWVAAGMVLGAAAPGVGQISESHQTAALAQVAWITFFGGVVALCAYFGGLKQDGSWKSALRQAEPGELLKYWWWPGLAFASTYYIALAGVVIFLLRQPGMPASFALFGGAVVGGLMALYGYYLGYRRQVEDQQGQSLSGALLRCPFVSGILRKSRPEVGQSVQAASGSNV
ncbi:MAG TPA: hypothetical protein VFS39_13875 [Nitrospira sp.]|nr:hypothetical protein [Nitrospira sp.]